MNSGYLFFLRHILFAIVIFGISAMATMLLVRHLKAFDIPNERSSHTRITPRGGGVAPTSSAAATGMTRAGIPAF